MAAPEGYDATRACQVILALRHETFSRFAVSLKVPVARSFETVPRSRTRFFDPSTRPV
jgi:hypothetical protein